MHICMHVYGQDSDMTLDLEYPIKCYPRWHHLSYSGILDQIT